MPPPRRRGEPGGRGSVGSRYTCMVLSNGVSMPLLHRSAALAAGLVSLVLYANVAAQQPAAPAFPSQPAYAADSSAAMQVVTDLFKGMRGRDTASMRTLFDPAAEMRTAITARTGMQVQTGQIGDFLKAIASAPDTLLLDERITAPVVRVD